MRLSFDHIHQDKMFKFLNDFDPIRLIDKLKSKCEKLADLFSCQVSFSEHNFFDYQIKVSDLYKVLNIVFTRDDLDLNLDFSLQIPDIRNSFCNVSGVRRYIQKQLCDTCFISMKSTTREKVVCEFSKSFTIVFSSQTPHAYYFNVQEMSYVEAIGLYKLLGGSLDKIVSIDDPVVAEFAEKYSNMSDQEILKSINPNMSTPQKKRLMEYVKVYYELSELLKDYFESPSDIIFQMIKNIEHLDQEQGLDLRNRRVRTSEEMIYTSFMSKIIDHLLDCILIANKKRRQKKIQMEPFETLYEFVLVENMFEAPLASVANRSRCTIVGNKGFTKGSVPVKIKDLHPTQYNCLDPAVTPDRDSAGVVLYLATTSELDQVGRFKIHDNIIKLFNK